MITLKSDPKIILPEIKVPIYNEPIDDNKSDQPRQQTKVDGILVPLVKVNNIVIDGNQVRRLKLKFDETPTIDITIQDSQGLIQTLDRPDNDSHIQIQLIPSFDKTYKKINLMFEVERCTVKDYDVIIHGDYEVPKFHNVFMKSYGKISSYELFQTIANDYQLGFSSNVEDTDDARYIYNPNMTPTDLMNQEISFSGLSNTTSEPHVFDWWIDGWNCLNFVDLYTEYKEVLPDDKMQLWTESALKADKPEDEYKPEQMLAMFTNLPQFMNNQLYISSYKNVVSSATATDLNFEVYDMVDLSRLSTLIMDGDVKNNIRMEYVYGGELFGDYDYLTRRACRQIFREKIESQCIEVSLRSPIFSLSRGSKVNIYWYDVNQLATSKEQEKRNQEITSNTKLPDSIIYQDAKFIINKTISGQYYIMSSEIDFKNGQWKHTFRLGRYADEIQK